MPKPTNSTILANTSKSKPMLIRCVSDIEQRYVTVLSTDLSGYTILCEKIDPIQVKNLIDTLFSRSVSIIEKNGGCVERSFGDEIVAVFGLPTFLGSESFHAVRAAIEIHAATNKMGTDYSETINHRIAMHTGIASGPVIIGKSEHETCRYGITGKAIVMASQLTDMAQADEIFVDSRTMAATAERVDYRWIRSAVLRAGKSDEGFYHVKGLR